MRATLRITWLLLLLNTQFSSIYSSDSTTNITVPNNETTGASTAVIAGTNITSTGNETGGSTATPATVPEKTTPSQKPAERINADANSTVTSPTIPVANNPPVPSTTAPTAIILSNPITATTTASKPPPVSNASATVQTHSDPVTSKIPEVNANQTGRNTVKSTITPEPPRSTEQTSKSLIYTSPVTSQGESSKGVMVTVPTTAHRPTASQDTRLPVIPVITTPSRAVGESTTDQPPIDPHKIPNDDKELSDAKAGTTRPPATTAIIINTPAQQNYFTYSLNNGEESQKDKHLVELCKRLMPNWQIGNCTLTYRKQDNKIQFDTVMIDVKTNVAAQYFEEITKEPTDNKTLIAILASCGGLLFMIIMLAVCAAHHRKPYNENQQHLTEELNTVENGYHDNPTLEVMEVQPEMQEKKMALNGEFNDSWIVPIDNLMKDDIPVEEDTHL